MKALVLNCASGVPIQLTVHRSKDGITQLILREWGLPDTRHPDDPAYEGHIYRDTTIDLNADQLRKLFGRFGAELHIWGTVPPN